MIANSVGKMVEQEWLALPNRFRGVNLDVFQLMPNHFHAIIEKTMVPLVGAGLGPALPAENNSSGTFKLLDSPTVHTTNEISGKAGASPAPTIGNIIGAFKSIVTNNCLQLYKTNNVKMGKLWQRNYYEHIIGNDDSYVNIANYIIDNPQRWETDEMFEPTSPL